MRKEEITVIAQFVVFLSLAANIALEISKKSRENTVGPETRINKIANWVSSKYKFDDTTGHLEFSNQVEVILPGVFAHRGDIIKVDLPERIKRIEDFAFSDCKHLKHIPMPDYIEWLGTQALSGTELESLELPNSVKELGDGCFARIETLGSVSIGSGLKVLPKEVFLGCNITTFIVPENIEKIEEYALAENFWLHDVVIPNSVKDIQENVLIDCKNITELVLPDGFFGKDGEVSRDELRKMGLSDEILDDDVKVRRYSDFIAEVKSYVMDDYFINKKGELVADRALEAMLARKIIHKNCRFIDLLKEEKRLLKNMHPYMPEIVMKISDVGRRNEWADQILGRLLTRGKSGAEILQMLSDRTGIETYLSPQDSLGLSYVSRQGQGTLSKLLHQTQTSQLKGKNAPPDDHLPQYTPRGPSC